MGLLKKVSLKPGLGGSCLGEIFSIFTESWVLVSPSLAGGNLSGSFLSGNKRQAVAELTLVTFAVSFDE